MTIGIILTRTSLLTLTSRASEKTALRSVIDLALGICVIDLALGICATDLALGTLCLRSRQVASSAEHQVLSSGTSSFGVNVGAGSVFAD